MQAPRAGVSVCASAHSVFGLAVTIIILMSNAFFSLNIFDIKERCS